MMEPQRFPTTAFADFSKGELLNFFQLLHQAFYAQTEEEVKSLLCLAERHVPCRAMIAGLVRSDDGRSSPVFHKIINVSYPEAWVLRYIKNRYAEIDPVLRQHMQTGSRRQTWTNTYQRASSAKGLEFIEEARSFGLTVGVTVGAVEPGQGLSSFVSFANDKEIIPPRYHAALECLSQYIHRALVRIAPAVVTPANLALSVREKTVLNWMRHGKTNWEISRILGVSERTVRFHAESIFNKLDVSSRTQAVAYAVENGLLTAQ
jgi:DNA-binding CsgD family transcriptional regulator